MKWPRENDFDAEVNAASARWNVPVALIKATIGIESGFNPLAVNRNDPGFAWGLMQMLPLTAKGLGHAGDMSVLLHNPGLAIDLGTRLLAQNLTRTGRVVADSVSAYNGGFRPSLGFGKPLASGRYGNQSYVTQVLDAMAYFSGAGSSGGTPPEAATFPLDPRARVGAPQPVPPSIVKEPVMPAQKIDVGDVIRLIGEVAHLIHRQVSDPVKDKERIARVDKHYAGAIAGDSAMLACLMSDAELIPQTAGCIVGSKVAVLYAKAKVVEYQLQVLDPSSPVGT